MPSPKWTQAVIFCATYLGWHIVIEHVTASLNLKCSLIINRECLISRILHESYESEINPPPCRKIITCQANPRYLVSKSNYKIIFQPVGFNFRQPFYKMGFSFSDNGSKCKYWRCLPILSPMCWVLKESMETTYGYNKGPVHEPQWIIRWCITTSSNLGFRLL